MLPVQLLRSSLVNRRIQAAISRDLGLDKLINFGSTVCVIFSQFILLVDVFVTERAKPTLTEDRN